MLLREISRILGKFLFYFCIVLIGTLIVSFFYDNSSIVFLETTCICAALAALFLFWGRKAKGILHRKESILLVSIIWLITAAVAALPFIFTNAVASPLDGYFEAMSALTTTGSSVFHQDTIESLGKGLLFWRSILQWLGGMGIIVLFIAILPALSMGGRLLFEAEVTGPEKESIAPRLKKTAAILWKIYVGLTAVQVILLMVTNPAISLFDAVTLSFSTISTGGFCTHNGGIAAYNNLNTESVIILFMLLGSINFSLYFYCFKGKFYHIYQPEFFAYLILSFLSSAFISGVLYFTHTLPIKEAIQYGSFQVISAQSSTGFNIANYDIWPASAKTILLIVMFIGGMSGSTSGGLKVSRLLILCRTLFYKVESVFRPDAIHCLKIGAKEVPQKTVFSVLSFFALFVCLSVLGMFLLVLDGIDPETAFSSIACFINNAGLSFGAVAEMGSYAFLPPFSKVVGILWMLMGRLEFFAILVLAIPAFWREK